MKKVIKGYKDFVNENNEQVMNDEEFNVEDELLIEDEVDSLETIEEEGYIGDKAMDLLSQELDVEIENNTITYEGYKVDFVSEFDGFLVKGKDGVNKVPVDNNDIEAAVLNVINLVGAGERR